MGSSESDVLLDLVKDMHGEIDRYLSDTASSSDAIPRILDMCREMRTKELSEAANYWLGTLERHAAEIASPRPRPGIETHLLTASVFLGAQTLNDIYILRTQLAGEQG